jgi:hypothetical protein
MRSKFGQPILCIFKQSCGLPFDFRIVWFLLCSKNKGKAYLRKKIKNILLYSSKFNMCTFVIETLHFLFVIVVLPFIFADDAIICLANYGRLLYFRKWTYVLPIVNTSTSCSHTFVLLFRWFYYVSSTFMWKCTSKTEHLYFLNCVIFSYVLKKAMPIWAKK